MSDKIRNLEFGILVALVVLFLNMTGYIHSLSFVSILLLATLIIPKIFHVFSSTWFGLARLLNKATTAILLFLIFSLVVTPVGLARRVLSYDTLLLRQFRKSTDSVFVDRMKTFGSEDFEKQY